MTVEIDTTTRPPLCLGKMAQPQPEYRQQPDHCPDPGYDPENPDELNTYWDHPYWDDPENDGEPEYWVKQHTRNELNHSFQEQTREILNLDERNKTLETENQELKSVHEIEVGVLWVRNQDLKTEVDRLKTVIINMVLDRHGPPPPYNE